MQKLSEEQKNLINDNYYIVLNNLKRHFAQPKYANPVIERQKDLPFHAISYMMEATAEWKPEKSKGQKFSNFATERCLMRFKDFWRKENSLHGHVFKNRTSVHDVDLIKFSKKEHDFYDTNLEDYKKFVVGSGDRFFSNSYNSLLHKKLIKEYIIPKMSGEEITIQYVANKIGVNSQIVKEIINSRKMKDFLNTVT